MSDDWDEEEAPAEAVHGHASEAGGTDIADAILALTGEVTKLAVILHELDEASFSKVKPRLKIFNDMVGQLPKEPSKRAAKIRVIGFVRPAARKRRPS